jgi:hypothetical protein
MSPDNQNSNPAGNPVIWTGDRPTAPAVIQPPSDAVSREQREDHTEADFLRDLKKASEKLS